MVAIRNSTMVELSVDLLDEFRQLAGALTPEQWHVKTPFYDWTARDEIVHLCFFDEAGLLAASDRAAFAVSASSLKAQLAAVRKFAALPRAKHGC